MKIPCICGYDRSVCVDCMQDHIDSLHDNLRKLIEEMREEVKASNWLHKGWNDVSRRLHSWADRFDRLLKGE